MKFLLLTVIIAFAACFTQLSNGFAFDFDI